MSGFLIVRTDHLLAAQGDFVMALQRSGLPFRRPPATGPLGRYPGRTFTGKSTAACRTHTTRRSAPLPRIGTLPLTVSAAWGSPFRRPLQHTADHIEASGSQVPHRSLNRARATSTPDTHLARNAGTRQTHPRATTGPWFRTVVHTLSTFHQRFTHVRLLGSHLTHHVRLFRNAHHHGSFTAAACGGLRPPPAWAVTEGPPPSPVQHRIQTASVYIGASFNVLGTPSSA